MYLRNNNSIVLLIVLFIVLFVTSCIFINPVTLFYSTSPDERFEASSKSAEIISPETIDVNDYSILVITDTHYKKNEDKYISPIMKSSKGKYSFIVVAGDITDEGFAEQCEIAKSDFATADCQVYTIIGNHDLYNDGFKNYLGYFGRSTYSFFVDNTIYIFLDTANGVLGAKQKKWYENLLKENSDKRIVVFSHYSLFDSVLQSPTAMPYPEEVYYLISINEKYGVDYFISGHLHKYDKRVVRGTTYISVDSARDLENSILEIHCTKDSIVCSIIN